MVAKVPVRPLGLNITLYGLGDVLHANVARVLVGQEAADADGVTAGVPEEARGHIPTVLEITIHRERRCVLEVDAAAVVHIAKNGDRSAIIHAEIPKVEDRPDCGHVALDGLAFAVIAAGYPHWPAFRRMSGVLPRLARPTTVLRHSH